MTILTTAITTLQTMLSAIGAALGVWGLINLLEGYGSDNPGANAHVPEGRINPESSRMTAFPLFRNSRKAA